MAYSEIASQAYGRIRKMRLQMSSFGKRFRAAREEAKLSQKAVAELFDPPLSRVAVANWEADTNLPEPDKLPALARALRRSIDYLLTGRANHVAQPEGHYNVTIGPEMRGKVPLISWVQAGSFSTIVDNLHPGDAEEWIPTSVPVHQHTYALRVRGDSMTDPAGDPSFPDGCVIVVEPDAIDTPDKLVGSFVIVKRASEGEATFKQLVKDAGRFYLKPLNPRYPMLELREDDVFCGVVREKVTRFF
jgi:SOS-response transcriptional repressor LexA